MKKTLSISLAFFLGILIGWYSGQSDNNADTGENLHPPIAPQADIIESIPATHDFDEELNAARSKIAELRRINAEIEKEYKTSIAMYDARLRSNFMASVDETLNLNEDTEIVLGLTQEQMKSLKELANYTYNKIVEWETNNASITKNDGTTLTYIIPASPQPSNIEAQYRKELTAILGKEDAALFSESISLKFEYLKGGREISFNITGDVGYKLNIKYLDSIGDPFGQVTSTVKRNEISKRYQHLFAVENISLPQDTQ